MSQNNDFEEVKRDSYMTSIFRPRCDACFRYKEDGQPRCLDLGHGRELCSGCSSIAVMDSDECNLIIQSVYKFYKIKDLKVDENIPIFFVDRNQMKRLVRDGALGVFIPSIGDSLKLPATLPIKLVALFIRLFIGRFQTIETYSRGRRDIKKVVNFLSGRAIVLLFGSPDIQMGATLAHEMMHAWFRLEGIPCGCCERVTEEGICELMAYKWLEWFPSSGYDNPHKTNQQVQYTKELKELLVERIRCQRDEVYGQGFLDAMRAIETFGFKPTLDHVTKNRALPLPMMDSTYSVATVTTFDLIKELKELLVGTVQSKREEIVEVCLQRLLDVVRAIQTFGFKPIMDHVVKNETLPQLKMDGMCSPAASTTLVERTKELKEVHVQAIIDSIRAIGTVGSASILDHAINNRTLLQLMKDSSATATATAVELIRKDNGVSREPDQGLCKASNNTTTSFWKATVATMFNFIWKAATNCETPRIVGHCHGQYYQGQSHLSLHEGMKLAFASVSIVFEHR